MGYPCCPSACSLCGRAHLQGSSSVVRYYLRCFYALVRQFQPVLKLLLHSVFVQIDSVADEGLDGAGYSCYCFAALMILLGLMYSGAYCADWSDALGLGSPFGSASSTALLSMLRSTFRARHFFLEKVLDSSSVAWTLSRLALKPVWQSSTRITRGSG